MCHSSWLWSIIGFSGVGIGIRHLNLLLPFFTNDDNSELYKQNALSMRNVERSCIEETIKTYTMAYLRGERAIIPKIFPCPWRWRWRRWGGLLSGWRAGKGASNSYSHERKNWNAENGKLIKPSFRYFFLKKWRFNPCFSGCCSKISWTLFFNCCQSDDCFIGLSSRISSDFINVVYWGWQCGQGL